MLGFNVEHINKECSNISKSFSAIAGINANISKFNNADIMLDTLLERATYTDWN